MVLTRSFNHNVSDYIVIHQDDSVVVTILGIEGINADFITSLVAINVDIVDNGILIQRQCLGGTCAFPYVTVLNCGIEEGQELIAFVVALNENCAYTVSSSVDSFIAAGIFVGSRQDGKSSVVIVQVIAGRSESNDITFVQCIISAVLNLNRIGLAVRSYSVLVVGVITNVYNADVFADNTDNHIGRPSRSGNTVANEDSHNLIAVRVLDENVCLTVHINVLHAPDVVSFIGLAAIKGTGNGCGSALEQHTVGGSNDSIEGLAGLIVALSANSSLCSRSIALNSNLCIISAAGIGYNVTDIGGGTLVRNSQGCFLTVCAQDSNLERIQCTASGSAVRLVNNQAVVAGGIRGLYSCTHITIHQVQCKCFVNMSAADVCFASFACNAGGHGCLVVNFVGISVHSYTIGGASGGRFKARKIAGNGVCLFDNDIGLVFVAVIQLSVNNDIILCNVAIDLMVSDLDGPQAADCDLGAVCRSNSAQLRLHNISCLDFAVIVENELHTIAILPRKIRERCFCGSNQSSGISASSCNIGFCTIVGDNQGVSALRSGELIDCTVNLDFTRSIVIGSILDVVRSNVQDTSSTSDIDAIDGILLIQAASLTILVITIQDLDLFADVLQIKIILESEGLNGAISANSLTIDGSLCDLDIALLQAIHNIGVTSKVTNSGISLILVFQHGDLVAVAANDLILSNQFAGQLAVHGSQLGHILDLVSVQGIPNHLSCVVTGQSGVGVNALNAGIQALRRSDGVHVDGPSVASEAFLISTIAQSHQQHTGSLGAGHGATGAEPAAAHTRHDALAVAGLDEALSPGRAGIGAHVAESGRCVGAQRGLLATIERHADHLAHLRAGDVVCGTVGTVFHAGDDVQRCAHIDGLFVLDLVLIRERGPSTDHHDA